MEDCASSISSFCSQLRHACTHLESSCSSLRKAVDQPPSTLRSDSNVHTSVLENLLDRVLSTSKKVENLEAITTGTISFEELLGHCTELYKQNEASLSALEEKLTQYGYVPPEEVENGTMEDVTSFDVASAVSDLNPQMAELGFSKHMSSTQKMVANITELQKALSLPSFGEANLELNSCLQGDEAGQYGSLYPGTLSLQDLGLSAAGLACLAQESSPGPINETLSVPLVSHEVLEQPTMISGTDCSEIAEFDSKRDASSVKPVNEDEYDDSPVWLKMQISFEDLNEFVGKIQAIFLRKASGIQGHGMGSGECVLDQQDLLTLGAGAKVKPCLLFLVRLGRLRTGHENGATVYHLVHC